MLSSSYKLKASVFETLGCHKRDPGNIKVQGRTFQVNSTKEGPKVGRRGLRTVNTSARAHSPAKKSYPRRKKTCAQLVQRECGCRVKKIAFPSSREHLDAVKSCTARIKTNEKKLGYMLPEGRTLNSNYRNGNKGQEGERPLHVDSTTAQVRLPGLDRPLCATTGWLRHRTSGTPEYSQKRSQSR